MKQNWKNYQTSVCDWFICILICISIGHICLYMFGTNLCVLPILHTLNLWNWSIHILIIDYYFDVCIYGYFKQSHELYSSIQCTKVLEKTKYLNIVLHLSIHIQIFVLLHYYDLSALSMPCTLRRRQNKISHSLPLLFDRWLESCRL